MEFYQEVERALTKDYRKKIWRPFLSALKDYKLVNDGDRIAVCISGGKDSMLLAKCMQELKRHSPTNFELQFLVMDPGYTPANRQKIVDNAKLLNIPISIFETDILNQWWKWAARRATCAPRCAAAISTARRRGAAATRSLSGTTTTT